MMIPILIVIFLILLVIKLEVTNWTWWINSIPLFIGIGWKFIIRIADDVVSIGNTEDGEEKSRKMMVLCIVTVALSIGLIFLITFVILCVIRLDGASFKVAIAFIPVFIIMACLQCCCMICGPCICCCRPGGDEEAPDMPPPRGEGGYQNQGLDDPPANQDYVVEISSSPVSEGELSVPSPKKPTEASPLKDID